MAWLAVIGVCIMIAIWLFSLLNGGSESASQAAQASPGGALVAIVVLAALALLGLFVLGSIAGS